MAPLVVDTDLTSLVGLTLLTRAFGRAVFAISVPASYAKDWTWASAGFVFFLERGGQAWHLKVRREGAEPKRKRREEEHAEEPHPKRKGRPV